MKASTVRRLGRYFGAVVLACSVLAASAAMGAPIDAASPGVRADDPAVAMRVPAAGIRDEAAMVLVGALLIGLASAVRRAA